MKGLSSEWWHRAGPIASMITAAVAIVALWDTARVTRQTARMQSLSVATSLLQDYMRLAIEHPELANRRDALPVDPNYEWLAAQAFVVAEGTHRLTRGDAAWDSTVSGIIHYHKTFVRDGKFDCPDWDPQFAEFVEASLGPIFKCMR